MITTKSSQTFESPITASLGDCFFLSKERRCGKECYFSNKKRYLIIKTLVSYFISSFSRLQNRACDLPSTNTPFHSPVRTLTSESETTSTSFPTESMKSYAIPKLTGNKGHKVMFKDAGRVYNRTLYFTASRIHIFHILTVCLSPL